MNKKTNIKPEDLKSYEDILGYPLRIPVSFLGSEMGDVIIDIEPNEKDASLITSLLLASLV
jgi:hypothetical protein